MDTAHRWNHFDTAYGLAGLFVIMLFYGRFGVEAVWLTLLLIVAYCAGRTAGAHH